MELEVGQKIKFNFHGFGVVSTEETAITEINNGVVTVSHVEPEYKFSLKSGKCLNDNSFMGCYRTLPNEYLQKPNK